jgi:hypothetical protein
VESDGNVAQKLNMSISNSNPLSSDKHQVGLIFHWGLYSIPAFDDIQSARRRSEHSGGGSEWIQARLDVDPKDFRPPSGWKPAQAYFAKQFPGMTYSDLVTQFQILIHG